MVNFVKPNLLGTEKEYKTNFVNPIVNGQFEDSTAEDIMFMKKRTHVLHKILNRTVQVSKVYLNVKGSDVMNVLFYCAPSWMEV